jgi:predicted amidohydrolase
MRVLLGQLEPAAGDVAGNAATVCDALAAHPDAELAVFPELFLCGYDLARIDALAIDLADPSLSRIADAATACGTTVVVGFAERTPDGIANAVACLAPGAPPVVYRKANLFGPDERAAFVDGRELVIADVGGHRLGLLICFDVEFPEPARALATAGARLLVTIAANMEPYGPDHALAARARALDNRRPHVYVNRTGEESGLRFVGASCVVDTGGGVVACLGADPELRCVDLDLASPVGDEVDYLSLVRELPVIMARQTS